MGAGGTQWFALGRAFSRLEAQLVKEEAAEWDKFYTERRVDWDRWVDEALEGSSWRAFAFCAGSACVATVGCAHWTWQQPARGGGRRGCGG